MDTRELKSNKVKVLNKILELGNLTHSQQLYLNYADKIGLDVNWLNERVICDEYIYKINGLIWKYKYISLEDDIVKNELLIELEYVEKYISPEKEKQLEEIKKQKHLQQTLVTTAFVPNSPTGFYMSSGTIINNSIADRYNLLTDENLYYILDGQVENPKIKNSSETGTRIVNLNTFIKKYRFEDSLFQMPSQINNLKFRLIVE